MKEKRISQLQNVLPKYNTEVYPCAHASLSPRTFYKENVLRNFYGILSILSRLFSTHHSYHKEDLFEIIRLQSDFFLVSFLCRYNSKSFNNTLKQKYIFNAPRIKIIYLLPTMPSFSTRFPY